jgi:hypothetical protein
MHFISFILLSQTVLNTSITYYLLLTTMNTQIYQSFLQLNGIQLSDQGNYTINGQLFTSDVPIAQALCIHTNLLTNIPTAYATPYTPPNQQQQLALANARAQWILQRARAHAQDMQTQFLQHTQTPTTSPATPSAAPPVQPSAATPASVPAPPIPDTPLSRILHDILPKIYNKRIRLIERAIAKKAAATQFECAICYESTICIDSSLTSCLHRFCNKCISTLVKNNAPRLACPMCRQQCSTLTFFKNRKTPIKTK